MSIDRANLPGSGAPKVTWNSGEFWTRDDVAIGLAEALVEQRASMYGRVTKTRGGRQIEINIPLFGLWNNLSLLFPSALINPAIGTRLYGTTDLPMVLLARNGDKLTIKNCQLVGMSNLKLAANVAVFSGMAKFVGLIANNTAPTGANAFYQFQTAQAYTEGAFALANLKAKTWTGAWGARGAFATVQTQDGWTVDWEVNTTDDLVDGVGAVDKFIDTFWGRASCIPVGPLVSDIEGALHFQGDAGSAVGAGIHSDVDDLVLGDGTSSVTLKNAALVETGFVFAPSKKRIGPTVWETTRGFTAGAPQAMAAVA